MFTLTTHTIQKYLQKNKQQKIKKSSGLDKLHSSTPNSKENLLFKKESKNKLKRKLKILIDKKDVLKVYNLFLILRKAIKNPSLEYGYVRTKSGNVIKLKRDEKNHLVFSDDLIKEGKEKGLHTSIHNHPQGTTPLSSPEDIRSYAEYWIKYGVSTNERGICRVKNKNKHALTETQSTKLEEKLTNIKKQMKKEFHEYLKKEGIDWKEYKKKDKSKYNRELNDFVDENIDRYVPMYQKVLNEYNMEITFI